MSDTERLQVLVIDDDVTQRMLAKEYLEDDGFVVRQAEDGRRGLGIATRTVPDVILLDLLLPSIDGFSLCRSLKETPQTAAIPVILMTAAREPDVIERGLAAGADDFVTKPVDWAFLSDRVHNAVKRARERAELSRKLMYRTLEAPKAPHIAKGAEQASGSEAFVSAETVLQRMRAQFDSEKQRLNEEHSQELEAALGNQRHKLLDAVQSGAGAFAAIAADWAARQAAQARTLETMAREQLAAGPSLPALQEIERAACALRCAFGQFSILTEALRPRGSSAASDIKVKEFLSGLVEEVAPFAGARRVSLDCQVPAGHITLRVEAKSLRYALLSLVLNAIQFSPPGGRVTLKAEADALGNTRMLVEDQGPGIVASRLTHLLSALEPAAILEDEHVSGAPGLGIPIALALSRQMGGRLDIKGRAGGGTTAILYLPGAEALADNENFAAAG